MSSTEPDDYDKGGLIAFVLSVSFCLLFFIYIGFFHPGVDLKELPKAGATPTQAVASNVPAGDVDISSITEPWEPNSKMVEHGHYVYENTCAMCHGPKGLGDGAAGQGLNPKPRNFVEGHWKTKGDSIALFKVLQTGLPPSAMPAWKQLPVKDRWALVQFIRSITHNKVPDDPKKLEEFAKTAD